MGYGPVRVTHWLSDRPTPGRGPYVVGPYVVGSLDKPFSFAKEQYIIGLQLFGT